MKQIASALIKAQQEMSNAVKGSTNPFFKNKYADLNSIREACIPALNNNGVVVLQPIVQIDGDSYIKTLLLHESGESLDSLTKIIVAKEKDAQSQGSGITYARRYGLQSFVCIGADDDDGNKASLPKEEPKAQLKSQPEKSPVEKILATTENLIKAVEKGFNFEKVKEYYKVTPEQEQEFNNLLNNKK